MIFSTEIEKTKIPLEPQNTLDIKAIPTQKKQSWRHHTPIF
jgi:hypothetical protein